jgi:hypothetical protein
MEWILIFGFGVFYGVWSKFVDGISEITVGPIFYGQLVKMGPTAVSETSSTSLPYTPCKTPKPKNQEPRVVHHGVQNPGAVPDHYRQFKYLHILSAL